MARQLDLFAASRTTEYRNSHQTVPRRLHGSGTGNKQVTRLVNRVNNRQSLRANRQALANGGRNGRSIPNIFAGRKFRIVKGSQRASSGHSGG